VQLGLLFRPEWPPEALPAFAGGAERDGFDELWVVEDCFLAGGPTMAATALAVTERLGVGVGLLPAAVRNPAIAAMEIAGLARLHPGRLTVAFGHGVEAWMRQIGARPVDRLVALEEVVRAVRALLAGEEVTVHGDHVRLDRVRLDHVPGEAPPLLIGSTGPRALELAGRVADGFLLPEASGPAAVRWARGLAGGVGAVYAWLSIDDDRDAAAEALRPELEGRMASYPRLFEAAGVTAVDLDAVRAMTIAGDAGDCVRAIAALEAAGTDRLVVIPRDEAQQARFVAEVMPRVGGGANLGH
jgi:5,10-methylenetetrahydromethanopterin reductase